MKYHLAILAKGWSELILDGKKTIESRFSQNRCAPFGKVNKGDIVYMKESAGLVKGMFRVAKVETFENLRQTEITVLYREYRDQIFISFGTDNEPPKKWLSSKHATLIHIHSPVKFDTPFSFPKRDSRAWVVLDAPLHTCDICHDNYLLEIFEGPDGELLHSSEDFCPPCYARECVSPDEELALAMEDSQD